MHQYLFYDHHLVYILATVWDTSMSISNSANFLHTVLDPLKQSRLDFSNPKQTFVRIQLLEIDLSCNSCYAEYQIYYRIDKMLVDCMFSQPYWIPDMLLR